MKKHLLWLVEIELSVQFSPPFANTFPDVAKGAKRISLHRLGGLHRLMSSSLRELRTSSGFAKFP
ncbi:hypothetical protein PG291_10315, partial [Riemerella anatipestifer]|nr:hypothetical protein [Riemerella anatipestifer]